MKWSANNNTIFCVTKNGYKHQIVPTDKKSVVGFMASYEYCDMKHKPEWKGYLESCIAEFDKQMPNYKFRR